MVYTLEQQLQFFKEQLAQLEKIQSLVNQIIEMNDTRDRFNVSYPLIEEGILSDFNRVVNSSLEEMVVKVYNTERKIKKEKKE